MGNTKHSPSLAPALKRQSANACKAAAAPARAHRTLRSPITPAGDVGKTATTAGPAGSGHRATSGSTPAGSTSAAELVLAVQQQMAVHPGFKASATAACITLAVQLKASRVSIGWLTKNQITTAASSRGAPKLMPAIDCEVIGSAMQESVHQQRSICSSNPDGVRTIALSSRVLAKQQSGGTGLVISMPLAVRQEIVGGLCIEFDARHAVAAARQRAALIKTLEAIVPVASRLLVLEKESDLSIVQRLVNHIGRLLTEDSNAMTRLRRWTIASLAAGLATILLMPMNMKISSEARIEGAVQRSVVAPTQGYLRSVSVRPGDIVSRNQVLATLGQRELELERDRLSGQLRQFEADESTAIAGGDRASMAVARAKGQQALAELALVEDQLEHTMVRAPFDGIVIDGDLRQAIGSPVDRGQNLFTIAPADSWRVLIELDEREVMRVHNGQSGVLFLSSSPWQSIDVAIVHIAPAAIVVDGQNIFEVQASVISPPTLLRPGLRGTVRLAGERSNLASHLSRRVSDALGRLIWRWQPW
ncbi:MAG: HlyD family efflux transporter periplasmic adaptor subunit [Burkholderiaceae bacterium]